MARLVDELANRILKDSSFSWSWNSRFCNLFFPDKKEDEEIIATLENLAPAKVLFAAVYTAFNDNETNGWSGYRREYKKNSGLDDLYELLLDLGYKMSDEEIKLRTGEHEAYLKE